MSDQDRPDKSHPPSRCGPVDIPKALRKKIPHHLQLPINGSSLNVSTSGTSPHPSARRLPSSSNQVPTLASLASPQPPRQLSQPEEDFQSALAAARECITRIAEQLAVIPAGPLEEKKRERALLEEGGKLVDALRRNVRVRYDQSRRDEALSV